MKFLHSQHGVRIQLSSAFLALACAVTVSAHAQARATATRGGGIAVFGGLIYERPGQGTQNILGESAGINFTAYVGHSLASSLEARGTYASGDFVRERTAVFGPRVTYNLNNFHPYGDFLIGGGTILYVPYVPRYQDRSTVFSYGGGVNYDLVYHAQIFADIQESHWQLGTTHRLAFEPTIVTVGVRYRVPFRPLIRHSDPDR